MILCMFPHSKPKNERFYERQWQGLTYSVAVTASRASIPHGSMPRMILAWIISEAIKNNSRKIYVGSSLREFLDQMGYEKTAGKRGTTATFRNQILNLGHVICNQFNATNLPDIGAVTEQFENVLLFSRGSLWTFYGKGSWEEDYLEISQDLFNVLKSTSFPIDFDTLKELKKSSTQIDLYCWLTWRMCALKKPYLAKWDELQYLFAPDLAKDEKGRFTFKKRFKGHFEKVSSHYETKCHLTEEGLQLLPSKTHVPRTT